MIICYNTIIRALVSDVTNAQSHHGGIIMSEKLYPIKDFEGLYSITKSGKVFRNNRLLKPLLNRSYPYVQLSVNGKIKNKSIHRLVAETFIQNPKNKRFINHIDGNKRNYNISNLEWVTSSENAIHSYKNGLSSSKSLRKLTDIEVCEIRKIYNRRTASSYFLAKKYNVSSTTIKDIIKFKFYKNVIA